MPLDRRITIKVTTPGMRNEFGEFVPGQTLMLPVWVTRLDSRDTFSFDGGSGLAEVARRRVYRVRWRSDIAGADPTNVTVTPDDGGDSIQTESIAEFSGRDGDIRRRWLDVTLKRPDA